MSDSSKIQFILLCGLRGYHEYRSIWTPTLHEVKQESCNAYDHFATACAKVTAMVMDTHHRRLPLVQGGLKIPIQVTVEMDWTEKN